MGEARYDTIVDFYVEGWSDACDDPATAAVLEVVGPIAGALVLDLACGHGRLARALARRGATVVGVDISQGLLDVARRREQASGLGIDYRWADLSAGAIPEAGRFDLVVCNFGLSDIDDLDGALSVVATALRPGGRFVLSMVHPCFPGTADVSGSWPRDQSYFREGRWTPTGVQSSLRRRVGTNHRTLSTYLNALTRHGLRCERPSSSPRRRLTGPPPANPPLGCRCSSSSRPPSPDRAQRERSNRRQATQPAHRRSVIL